MGNKNNPFANSFRVAGTQTPTGEESSVRATGLIGGTATTYVPIDKNALLIERERYGTGKPRRVVLKGKITR